MDLQPTVSGGYQYLGRKTLFLFILNRSRAALVLLIVFVALFFLFNSGVPAQFSFFGSFPVNLHEIIRFGAFISFYAFLVLLGIAILIGWLVYVNYRFSVGEDALKIKRGVLNKEEIAIPFRQIQDVTIVRDLSYQVWGLSKLVILTAGREDRSDATNESEGVLPAIDKNLAERLQEELLKRANIEKTIPADKSN